MKETFCYLGDTIGDKGSEVDGFTTTIKSGWWIQTFIAFARQ